MSDSYTVSEVNKFIKQIFSYEQIFYNISVKGEVSNFKCHASGNMFFTLKDEHSSIKCVVFKMYAQNISFFLDDGMFVYVRGDLSVYEKNGVYQINVYRVSQKGEGLIQKKLKNLQQKLLEEGLFNFDHKLSLKRIPKVVGVVTAIDGAALQDIIKILSKRLPILKLKVFSCLVQGDFAVPSILKALNKAAKDVEVDNLIVCRGGGSKEDLNPFDDEQICRAVYEIKKPTISAIGHETDNCLLDLVADLRAPTPSAAAQMVCVDYIELIKNIDSKKILLKNYFQNFVDKIFFNLKSLENRLLLISPRNVLIKLNFKLVEIEKKLTYLISKLCLIFEKRLDKIFSLLEVLSPLNVLNKGYCLAFDETMFSIKHCVGQIELGTNLNLLFSDGKLKVKVIDRKITLN